MTSKDAKATLAKALILPQYARKKYFLDHIDTYELDALVFIKSLANEIKECHKALSVQEKKKKDVARETQIKVKALNNEEYCIGWEEFVGLRDAVRETIAHLKPEVELGKDEKGEPEGAATNSVIRVIPEKVEEVYQILKNYFDKQQQDDLRNLLQGETIPTRLQFKGQGNKLSDAFEQLYNYRYIMATTKTALQYWMQAYFTFQYKGVQKEYSQSYLNRLLTEKGLHCKNPILSISKKGDIERF